MIFSVLATDLSKHFDVVGHLKNIKRMKKGCEDDFKWLFKAMIKMSDLSHVTKELTKHKYWTNCITEEFHKQGDMEKEKGLEISPLCARNNSKLASGQVGFFSALVLPLFKMSERFFKKNGRYQLVMERIQTNKQYWADESKKEEKSVSINENHNNNNNTNNTNNNNNQHSQNNTINHNNQPPPPTSVSNVKRPQLTNAMSQQSNSPTVASKRPSSTRSIANHTQFWIELEPS